MVGIVDFTANSDWIWAVVDIVTALVPITQFVSDPAKKHILRGLDRSITGIGIESSGPGF